MFKKNQFQNKTILKINQYRKKTLLNKNKKMENYLSKQVIGYSMKKLFYLIPLLNQEDKQRKDHKTESECHLNLFKNK